MTHGSSTGFNTRDELKQKTSQDVSVPEAVMSTGIMQPVLGTVPAAAVTGAMGLRNLWHRLEKGRQSTINDIITDAVFDPTAARRLLQGSYKLAGTPGPAIAPRAAIRGAQEGMSEIEERENRRRREGRKAGGRIGGINHGSIAMSLIRAAEAKLREKMVPWRPVE